MATTYLSRTFGSAGNRKTWTQSFWVKKSSNGVQMPFLNTFVSSHPTTNIIFTTGDALNLYNYNGSSYDWQIETNRKFRDNSAWYHIVVECDTTQTTASDRLKIYVNGEQETSLATSDYPTLNFDNDINQNIAHEIGKQASLYLDGVLAHYHFIDGTAYDASAFGLTDSASGIWKPKISPSVTYGTNGFFLKFANSASLGTDSSGNANNFTLSGSGTQTLDTPSNVFATWNSLIKTAATFSNGNTSLNNTSTPYKGSMATIVPTQGKWYAEIKAVDATTAQIGFITADTLLDGDRSLYSSSSNIYWQTNVTTITYYLNSVSQGNATVTGGTNSVSTYTDNDIIMLAMDLDNGYGWFGKNGTWQNSGDPAAGTNAFNLASDYANGTTFFAGSLNANLAANFGNGYFGTTAVSTPESDSAGLGKFEYSVPSGFYALCTKNIADYG